MTDILKIKQSDPRQNFRRVYFTAVDFLNVQNRLQTSDFGAGNAWTATISKNGASPGAIAGTGPTQVDGTNFKGLFYVELAVADISTVGWAVLRLVNTGGASKTSEQREIPIQIEPAYFFAATTGTLSTTQILTDRPETTVDFWKDALVLAHTGTLTGQVKKVGAYSAGKVLTLATGLAFTAAPANGDIFEFINR